MTVICNGVDLARFRPDAEARRQVRDELGLPAGSLLVGLIARLHPQKDHQTFFEAVRALRQSRPDVHFVLAGQRMDAREPQVAALLRQHQIDDGVHLLGERHDVPRICAALDLATSSSAWGEGFPNVLCEAMACEVPCVATDAGDAKLIIGDTGRVVARRDPRALCAAWLDLLSVDSAERSRLGRAARDRVARHYDQRASTERYAQLYRQLGGGCSLMCGIAGFLESRPLSPAAASVGERMASAILRRGPDDHGVWCDATAGIVLAHRRLVGTGSVPGGSPADDVTERAATSSPTTARSTTTSNCATCSSAPAARHHGAVTPIPRRCWR